MHNKDGRCLYKEHSALADLPERTRIAEIAKLHGVTTKDISNAVLDIRAIIVADAYAEFTIGKSLLDINVASFSRTMNEDSFSNWNKTSVSFSDVQLALFNLIERSKHESSHPSRRTADKERLTLGSQQQP